MILLIPYTKFTLKTYLSAYETEQRLAAHVEPRKMRWGLSRNHKFFSGTLENGKFNLNRIIHYRNSFLPIIVGQIHDDLDTNGGAFPIAAFFGFIILFYGISMTFFNYEANKARRHLEEIFQVKPESF